MTKNIGLLLFLCLLCLTTVACGRFPLPLAGEIFPGEARTGGSSPVDKDCAYYYFLKAKTAEKMEQDHQEEALEAYEKALVCDEGSGYIRRELAMFLARSGKIQLAIEKLTQANALDPSDTGTLIMLANFYTSAGKFDTAVEIYKKVLIMAPDNSDVRLVLASLYARQKRYEEAQAMLEELVARDKNSIAGLRYLAGLYREMQLTGKAIATYTRALEIQWSDVLAFEIAEYYDSLERYDDAIAMYRRILEDDPASERAHYGIARNYIRQHKTDEALAELRELAKYVVDGTHVYTSIGQLLLSSGRHDEAIVQFTELLKENPRSGILKFLLALAYHQKGNNDQAKQLLRGMDPKGDGYEDGILLLVRIYRSQKDLAGAEQLLTSVLKEEGTRKLPFYLALATMYREEKKNDAAKTLFEEIFRVYPGDPKALFDYAIFLDQNGDQEGAVATMEEILAKEPENAYALNYIGYTWAEKGIRLDEAETYLRKAVTLRSEDGYIRDSLGWIYYKRDMMPQAMKELEKAVELAPDDPTIREHLGDVYVRLGRFQDAANAYEVAIELFEEEVKKLGVKRKLESLHPQKNGGGR